MRFLTPAFLGLAALAVPIIVLYMLRLRRREVTVSSVMLWQRLVQDREANAPWQRLKRNLLLLLQLLILGILVFALARPYLPVPTVASGSVAVLLDASASMNAEDMPGSQTRFEAAQDLARDLVTDLSSDEEMTVIAVGPVPRVLAPPSADRVVLREAIEAAEPSAAPADWSAALSLAAASIAGHEDTTIVIISDGGLPEELPPLPGDVRYVGVGRASENLAISAMATRPLDEQPQLFVAVTNYGTADADTILSIEADGALVAAERLTVPAGGTADLTIEDLSVDVDVIRASLSEPVTGGVEDVLPLDDEAFAVYAPPASGRALLVTDANLFLEQVLTALPNVEAFQAPPGDLPSENFDLMIFDGWLPDELPDTNLLIINPPESTELFSVGPAFEETQFQRHIEHPILAFVDFSDVAIREAVALQPTGWAQNLIEAEGGPLLVAGQVGGRRVAVMTFDIHASNLPLKISFPILIANLLEWYAPARPFDAPDSLSPGESVVLRPTATTTSFRIVLPDSTVRVVDVDQGIESFATTEQLGIYTVDLMQGDDLQTRASFAVNLFSAAESDITPADSILIGDAPVLTGGDAEEDFGQRGLWPWFAGAALLVLIIEWWVYHRGTTLPRIGRQEDAAERRRRVFYPGRRS